ncbi:hypothetical protein QWU01_09910 [Kluyvera cryocrescens]|uniref:Uncharacterized protein n=1 Tax=Kluyvera cryocrescens TaxID=580 RepID=A0AAW9C4A5_KLUCR|nr:hypothetical protein [Kluyvera cryocrescens]
MRDTGNQKQDINDLSRDTANAHEKLETIFDKDTEQKRIDRNFLNQLDKTDFDRQVE